MWYCGYNNFQERKLTLIVWRLEIDSESVILYKP